MIDTNANRTTSDDRLDELLAECLCRADALAAALARGEAPPEQLARLHELTRLVGGASGALPAAKIFADGLRPTTR